MKKALCFLAIALVFGAFCENARAQIPNVRISSPSFQLQNEEQVFFSPIDNTIVLATWRDFRLGYRRCAIGRSADGGATWSDSLNELMVDMDNWQSDPTMVVDADGNFICSYLDFSPNVPSYTDSSFIAFIRSTDNGATWGGPYQVSTAHGPWFEDKQFIAADRTSGPNRGNVYVAWARFPNPTRMMFARSTNGGVTFDDTLIIGPSQIHEPCGDPIDAGQFAQPIVGADGSVYVFWSGYQLYPGVCDGYYAMKMSKSFDGGQTWPIMSQPICGYNPISYVDGGIDVYNCPAGDADISGGPYSGRIYISTTNGNQDGPYYHGDIVMIKSEDGGSTWSAPLRVNDDPLGGNFDQFHPWLIVNEDGVIATIFYDQRMDPNHFMFDVFAAYSFDGGETFTTNHRLTEVSSSPDDLKAKSFVSVRDASRPDEGLFDEHGVYQFLTPMAGRIAEYIGVTAYHDNIVAVWTDTRNGNQDVYGAYYTLPFLRPRLYGVADGGYMAGNDSLYWSTCWHEGDVSYRLEIDDDPLFASLDLSADVIDNKLYPASLPAVPDGDYYWRVKAFRAVENDSTEYSPVWSFTLDRQDPAPVTLIEPSDGGLMPESRPMFTWSSSKSAGESPEFFEIEIAGDPGFSGMPPYFHYTGLTATTFQIPDSLPNVRIFYWRVNHYDLAGNASGYCPANTFFRYICGDANGDGSLNVGDAVYLIGYVFRGGKAPYPVCAGNANGDSGTNLGDAVYMISYVFKGGAPPVETCCP